MLMYFTTHLPALHDCVALYTAYPPIPLSTSTPPSPLSLPPLPPPGQQHPGVVCEVTKHHATSASIRMCVNVCMLVYMCASLCKRVESVGVPEDRIRRKLKRKLGWAMFQHPIRECHLSPQNLQSEGAEAPFCWGL